MACSVHQQTYVARTCLKWSADGSLSEHDRSELIKRLCLADAALAQTHACHVQDDAQLTGYESPQMKRFLRTKADEPKDFELSALDRERTPPQIGGS